MVLLLFTQTLCVSCLLPVYFFYVTTFHFSSALRLRILPSALCRLCSRRGLPGGSSDLHPSFSPRPSDTFGGVVGTLWP